MFGFWPKMDRRQFSGFDSNPIQTSSSKIISKHNLAFRDADLKDFHRQFLDKAPYNAIIISKDFGRSKKSSKLRIFYGFEIFKTYFFLFLKFAKLSKIRFMVLRSKLFSFG